MLDSVLNYVKQVNEGKIAGDAKIGRYLLETLASVPLASTSKGSFDEDFNSHLAVSVGSVFRCLSPQTPAWSLTLRASFPLSCFPPIQDLLMVSYLANVVRVNLEVSARASMLHDARLAPRAAA